MDLLERPMGMAVCFHMDGDDISAGFGKGRNLGFWVLHHEVYV